MSNVTPAERTLRSGRILKELPEAKSLTINTKFPGKFVAIDLETGEVFMGSKTGWREATNAVFKETVVVLRGY